MWALIVITLLANSTYADAVEVVRNYNTQIECDKKLDKTIIFYTENPITNVDYKEQKLHTTDKVRLVIVNNTDVGLKTIYTCINTEKNAKHYDFLDN